MEFDTLGLRQITLTLQEPFETSFGKAEEKNHLILEAKKDDQWFYGEAAPLRHPLFNSETIFSAKEAISRYVTMALQHSTSIAGYQELISHMKGHNSAKAAGDQLLYHKKSVETGTPIAELIGATQSQVDCGTSISIKAEDEIVETVQTHVDAGYKRIKLKIKPGNDVEYVATVREQFPELDLMVDANAAYTLDDIDRLRRLDAYDLMMIEQPLGHTDLVNHSMLADEIETPICLDESIRSAEDVRRASAIDACEVVNLKPQRVSGLHESARISEVCQEHGLELWVGGVGESGIGLSFSVCAAALDGVTLPGETAPTGRYYEETIMDSTIELEDGQLSVPDTPGLIAPVGREKLEAVTVDYQELEADATLF